MGTRTGLCYNEEMAEDKNVMWERKQAELWDRVFQVTQDVVSLVDVMGESKGHRVVQEELVRAATGVGAHLVRANAAETAGEFDKHIKEARFRAIESDYWLRLIHVLQQNDEVRRDLSSLITQYAAVISLLRKFIKHTNTDRQVIANHAKGPKVSL